MFYEVRAYKNSSNPRVKYIYSGLKYTTLRDR